MGWLDDHHRLARAPRTVPAGADPGDEAAIRDLISACAIAYDAQDLDALVASFADDAAYTSALGTYHGVAAIRGYYENLIGLFERTMHFVTNLVVRQASADAAEAAAYMQAYVVRRDGVAYGMGALYNDRFVKRDGRWLLAARTVTDGVVHRIDVMAPEDRLVKDD